MVFECLAERTIALAQKARLLDPSAGFDPLLEERLEAVLPLSDQVRAQAGQAQTTANEALQRASEAHKLAQGKFLYDVVLSDDAVKFPVNRDELSSEAKARLDTLAQRVKTENKNVYLEIQGFTDASGDPKYNEKLGEARAESMRKYLHRQGIALNRMTTISYGEETPWRPTARRRAAPRTGG